jgi:hypothetical protein
MLEQLWICLENMVGFTAAPSYVVKKHAKFYEHGNHFRSHPDAKKYFPISLPYQHYHSGKNQRSAQQDFSRNGLFQ